MKSLDRNLIDSSFQDINYLYGNEDVDNDQMVEIRNRFCVALKGILWEKF